MESRHSRTVVLYLWILINLQMKIFSLVLSPIKNLTIKEKILIMTTIHHHSSCIFPSKMIWMMAVVFILCILLSVVCLCWNRQLNRKHSNHAGKSIVLTSTPEKAKIKEKKRLAEEKEHLANKKKKITEEKNVLPIEKKTNEKALIRLQISGTKSEESFIYLIIQCKSCFYRRGKMPSLWGKVWGSPRRRYSVMFANAGGTKVA